MSHDVLYLQLLPADVLHHELTPLLAVNDKDAFEREKYRSAIRRYKVLAILLLLLFTALFYWIVFLYWPKEHFPCIPYNCTFAPYNDQGRENGSDWCDSQGCVWGVDIGYGQGFWMWGTCWGCSFNPYNNLSFIPPHPNPTTCYHPPPLNPDSWSYCCDELGGPNWINGWNCMPVFECKPETAVGTGLMVFIILCPILTAIVYSFIIFRACTTTQQRQKIIEGCGKRH
jgi:hypothetical protein